MIALTYKSTHYATIALKVLIVVVTCWYLYRTVGNLGNLNWYQFQSFWEQLGPAALLYLLATPFINWGLEAKKWQYLVRPIKGLTYLQAWSQTHISFALSVTTPNRLGEYPAKTWFFDKADWKRILFLNLVGNSAQMLITFLMGCVGLFIWAGQLPLKEVPSWGLWIGFSLGMIALLFWMTKPKGTLHLWKRLPTVRWKNALVLSALRYLIFGSALFVLLLPSSSGLTVMELIGLIGCYYLLSSLLPSWMILDVVVKGSLAVWLFGWGGMDPILVMSAILVMWVLNYLLPALVGSWIFLRHKPQVG